MNDLVPSSASCSAITFTTGSAAETQALGEALALRFPAGIVLVLSGDLGAGKTQFIKGLARGLGSEDAVTSPTFNLMHIYTSRAEPVLYHFDLYRLDSAQQLDDLDYFAYLEDEVTSAVEWGERFSEALPTDYLLLEFGFAAKTGGGEQINKQASERIITLSAHGTVAERLIGTLQKQQHKGEQQRKSEQRHKPSEAE